MSDSRPVLLYDGLCGLCDRTVQVALQVDQGARVRFAPLQGPFAAAVTHRHPDLREVDSLVLVEEPGGAHERVLVRSEAVLALVGHLGGVWRAAVVFRIVPRFLRDAVYDFVARHRLRVFGRREACRIPTAQERERFLD
jgi:predicted DCC family thiol-disulfide oxidoreductase YuxK